MKWPRRKHQRRPRFSIVMFTKNGMPFVRDAVASLEAQAFEDYGWSSKTPSRRTAR